MSEYMPMTMEEYVEGINDRKAKKPLTKDGKWHCVDAATDWAAKEYEVIDSIGGRVCYVRWRKQEETLVYIDPRVK